MDVSLTALRAFLVVAEELHFGRAAARLYTSGPSLSQHIKRLEDQLGFPLFDRSSRRVELTDRGRQFVELAQQVVAAHAELSAWAERSRRSRPTIRIGFWSREGGYLIRKMVSGLLARIPELDLQLRHLSWATACPAVVEGHVDVALCPEPTDMKGLRATPIMSDPRVLAVAADHRLATRSSVRIAETSDEPHIAGRGGPDEQRRWWLVDPRPDGSRPRLGPTAADTDEMLELVAAGLGVNITGALLQESTRRPDVAFIPIEDIEPTCIVLVAREQARDPLISLLEEIAAEVGRNRGTS